MTQTKVQQAEAILEEDRADVVLLAREFLRDPYWPIHAAEQLGSSTSWPVQYERAAPSRVDRRNPLPTDSLD